MAVKHRYETVPQEGLDLQERVVHINRVAKVVKGGRRFSFTALVVGGDENSVVGIGYGKAREVPIAIQKGVEQAKKNLFRVPKYKSTITHQIHGRYGSGHVFLKPAAAGTGVIAGGGVRAVLELGGVHDILAKSLGSQNPINLVKATAEALQSLRRPEEVAKTRGLTVHDVLGIEKYVPPEPVVADGAAVGSVSDPTKSGSSDGSDTDTADAAPSEQVSPASEEAPAEVAADKAPAIETVADEVPSEGASGEVAPSVEEAPVVEGAPAEEAPAAEAPDPAAPAAEEAPEAPAEEPGA